MCVLFLWEVQIPVSRRIFSPASRAVSSSVWYFCKAETAARRTGRDACRAVRAWSRNSSAERSLGRSPCMNRRAGSGSRIAGTCRLPRLSIRTLSARRRAVGRRGSARYAVRFPHWAWIPPRCRRFRDRTCRWVGAWLPTVCIPGCLLSTRLGPGRGLRETRRRCHGAGKFHPEVQFVVHAVFTHVGRGHAVHGEAQLRFYLSDGCGYVHYSLQ